MQINYFKFLIFSDYNWYFDNKNSWKMSEFKTTLSFQMFWFDWSNAFVTGSTQSFFKYIRNSWVQSIHRSRISITFKTLQILGTNGLGRVYTNNRSNFNGDSYWMPQFRKTDFITLWINYRWRYSSISCWKVFCIFDYLMLFKI